MSHEFHVSVHFTRISREARHEGRVNKCMHLDHLFHKYLRKRVFTNNPIPVFLFQGRNRLRPVF